MITARGGVLQSRCSRTAALLQRYPSGRTQDAYAELGEIVAGKKPGRTSESEIIIFDSTGTALQDVAAAAIAYERAIAAGRGSVFDLQA